jgi:hypothetical protein
MLPLDQHVPVYGDQKLGDVGTHFDTLAQIGHKHDFVVLSEPGVRYRRAKQGARSLVAIAYRVENEQHT